MSNISFHIISLVPFSPMQGLASIDTVRSFLSLYDTFLIDCDGVLWNALSSSPMKTTVQSKANASFLNENILSALNYLQNEGKKRLLFVTNNSTKSRQSYKEKFKSLGFNVDLVRQKYRVFYFF